MSDFEIVNPIPYWKAKKKNLKESYTRLGPRVMALMGLLGTGMARNAGEKLTASNVAKKKALDEASGE